MDTPYTHRVSGPRLIAIVAAAAIAGGLVGGVTGMVLGDDAEQPAASARPAGPTDSGSEPTASPGRLTASQIYAKDSPGVVLITETQTQVIPPTFFTPRQRQQVGALGSGFVVDLRGDVVTNEHVVDGATGIRIGFSNGATYPATIVGTDPSTDIAVVRVKAPASVLHPLAFGDSTDVRVGDPAYAIGNPFGLERTMTAGIVSATGRDIQAPNALTIPNVIQTDAPINHGNSGGPLLDRYGRVIGVSAQIEGGTVDANVGIGFAIPSNTARAVAEQLIATGHAEHAWLGVQIETIDPDVARVLRGLPRHGVTVVKVVPGSPAARAGLQFATQRVTASGTSVMVGGDAIIGIDRAPVDSASELSAALARRKPGDTVTLDVIRDGSERTVSVVLGNAPR